MSNTIIVNMQMLRGGKMKRFPKSKGKIQAVQIYILKFIDIEGDGPEEWLRRNNEDAFGEPIICTVEDLKWAEFYVWERCQKLSDL